MSIENIIEGWKEVRAGLIEEANHRGQLTVYERLLNIEPALTTKFRKAFGESPP